MKKRAWSLALAVLMLLSLVPISAMADDAVSGTYTDGNGITYTLESGTLTISGEGECSDAWQACLDGNAVTAVVIEDGITSIGDYALIACSSLKSVSIGSGVTAIGDYAFYGCEALTGITIPDSVISIGSSASAMFPRRRTTHSPLHGQLRRASPEAIPTARSARWRYARERR